jgi:Fur family ferric uptake transcriptional regulator
MKIPKHHHGKPHGLIDFTGRLREKSRTVTRPRKAILELLRAHHHPLTNREIWQALRQCDCDLATVYRSIHLLQELGMVKRYDFGDGVARFELVHSEEDNHHHHLICTGCATIVELDDCFPPELEKRIADSNGFTGVSHKLEFFGLCPSCQ